MMNDNRLLLLLLTHVQEWPGGSQAAAVGQVECWWGVCQGLVRQKCLN